MNAPLSLFLTSFTASAPPLPLPAPASFALDAFEDLTPEPIDAEESLTLTMSELDRRDQAAADAARGEAEDLHAAALNALRSEHEAALGEAVEAARAAWIATESERLTTLFDEAMTSLRTSLEAQIAAALRPFLKARVLDAAMASLSGVLGRLVADPHAPVIHVSGPADLLERLAELRPEAGIDWSEADGPEIHIVADAARIETKIAAAFAAIDRTES